MTYDKDYTYVPIPTMITDYPAIGHDRRYDNLEITRASGLFLDTRAIGADWRMRSLQVILILTIIGTSSCRFANVPKSVKREFTYCYDDKDIRIDSLINVKGYYSFNQKYPLPYDQRLRVGIIYESEVLFKKDGTITWSSSGDIDQEIKKIKNGKKSWFYEYGFWGKYIIEGDTIKAQITNHPSPLSATWMPFEVWFKVVSRDHIQLIASRYLYYDKVHQDKSRMNLVELEEEEYLSAKFKSLDVELPSKTWLKKKKWFWCEEEQYKEWKKNRLK